MDMYYKENDSKEMFYDILDEYKGKESLHGTEYDYVELTLIIDPVKIERAFNVWVIKLKEEKLLLNQISSTPEKNIIWNPDKDKLHVLRKAEALAKEVIDGDLS